MEILVSALDLFTFNPTPIFLSPCLQRGGEKFGVKSKGGGKA